MDVSRDAAAHCSCPAVAGFRPPTAPEVLTRLRSPLISGFAAVALFGLAMYTKCVPAVVETVEPIVMVGAVALTPTAEIVVAVATVSVSAVVPMSTVMPAWSQLRRSAS